MRLKLVLPPPRSYHFLARNVDLGSRNRIEMVNGYLIYSFWKPSAPSNYSLRSGESGEKWVTQLKTEPTPLLNHRALTKLGKNGVSTRMNNFGTSHDKLPISGAQIPILL